MRLVWRLVLLGVVLLVIAMAVGMESVHSEQYSFEGMLVDEMKVKDVWVTYSTMGNRDDQAVVFLHGVGGDVKDALTNEYRMMQVLAEDYYVVSFDHPGFRRSGLPGRSWTKDDYVEYVDIALNKLAIEKPIMVGQSVGGVIALEYTMQNPTRVKMLILAETSKHWKDQELDEYIATYVMSPAYKKVFDTSLGGVQKLNAQNILGVPEDNLNDDWGAYRVMGSSLHNLFKYDKNEFHLLSKESPVIILWNSSHVRVNEFLGRNLSERLPNSDIVNHNNSSASMTDRPWELLDLINNTIDLE